MRVAVIGAGNWGTALAVHAARAGHGVRIWSRNDEVVESINREHTNAVYLSGAQIPESVTATRDIALTVREAELLILAAPSHATRELITAMRAELRSELIVVSATKGIETNT